MASSFGGGERILRHGRFVLVTRSDGGRTLQIHNFARCSNLAWGLIGGNTKAELQELCASLNGGKAVPKSLGEAKLRLRFWELAKAHKGSRDARQQVLRRLTPTLLPEPEPGQRAKRGKAAKASGETRDSRGDTIPAKSASDAHTTAGLLVSAATQLKNWCLAQLELHGVDRKGLKTRWDAQAALAEAFLRNAHLAFSAADLEAKMDHVVSLQAKATARINAQMQQEEHQEFLGRVRAGDYGGVLVENPHKFVTHWKENAGQAFPGDTLVVPLPDEYEMERHHGDDSPMLRDLAQAAETLGVHQVHVLDAFCSPTVVLARHAAALPAAIQAAKTDAAEREERRREMQEAAARRRQQERRRWEEIERKEDLAREEHARRRKASVQAQTPWDVRGKWELTCEESKQFGDDFGSNTLIIVGDGRSKLMGKLALAPMEGVMKLRRVAVSASSRCARFRWGARETGEGEMSYGEELRGEIVFHDEGRSFHGWINGGFYGCTDLSGRLVEAHATLHDPPAPAQLLHEFKRYNAVMYEHERGARWPGGFAHYPSDSEDGYATSECDAMEDARLAAFPRPAEKGDGYAMAGGFLFAC